jgi:hypothetical protein
VKQTTPSPKKLAPAAETEKPADDASPTVQAKAAPEVSKPVVAKKPEKRRLTALDKVKIMGLLRGAETALAESRLQSPKGNNAYQKYRAVLDLDPENRAAKQGLVEVASRYLSLSRAASSAGNLDEGRQYMARGASIAPHHPDLPATRKALLEAGS